MIREKLVPPFPFYLGQDLERTRTMARKRTLQEVLLLFKQKWGNRFDYSQISEDNYVNMNTSVPIVCPTHGLFEISPREHLIIKRGCPRCGTMHRGNGSPHTKARTNVLNVAINDSPNSTSIHHKHKVSYSRWKAMIERCYGEKGKGTPYENCEVCEEWLRFSNYEKWFDENYVEGYHLDKDVLVKGNKIYSPQTCCFIPPQINTLTTKHNATRGSLPIGVAKTSDGKKYRAILRVYGEYKNLGRYETSEDAFFAYKRAKEAHVKEVATKYYNEGKITKKVYNALMNYKVEITD